jgi:hypothetical protein
MSFCVVLLSMQDAQRCQAVKEQAAQKHTNVFSFHPDIGPAKHRAVELDREQFVQRLYDHRLQQVAETDKLRRDMQKREAANCIKMKPEEIDMLLER